MAVQAISGLEYLSRVFKGYDSYEATHSAWDGFTGTGHLLVDVASGLGTRQYPTPQIASLPITPQHQVLTYSIPMPLTPHSSYTLTNTVKLAASPSNPSLLTATLNFVHEKPLRADNEDFWVILTDPGTHQGW